MADPARAEVEDAAARGQIVGIVLSEEADGIIVDVRHEAGAGVELWIWGLVFTEEVAGGVGKG